MLVDLLLDDRSASVGIDYAEGMRQAVTYLHGLGHRNIGFIGFPNSEKYIAFWQTLAALGSLRAALGRVSPVPRSSVEHAVRLPGDAIDPGRGIPAHRDDCHERSGGAGAKDALAVAGIEVPKRMSVMGFDDLGVETDRPLTTMRTDSAEVGRLACAPCWNKFGVKRGRKPALPYRPNWLFVNPRRRLMRKEKEPKHDSHLGPIARAL